MLDDGCWVVKVSLPLILPLSVSPDAALQNASGHSVHVFASATRVVPSSRSSVVICLIVFISPSFSCKYTNFILYNTDKAGEIRMVLCTNNPDSLRGCRDSYRNRDL